MFGKRLGSTEGLINRSGKSESIAGPCGPGSPPPLWLLLLTAVNKQNTGRVKDARCFTPKAAEMEREGFRLMGCQRTVTETEDGVNGGVGIGDFRSDSEKVSGSSCFTLTRLGTTV